jgi:hypothetical protein
MSVRGFHIFRWRKFFIFTPQPTLHSHIFQNDPTIIMTLSTPIKIVVACFAVAALMATAMSGSSSETTAGLKGSARKLTMDKMSAPVQFFSFLGNPNIVNLQFVPDVVSLPVDPRAIVPTPPSPPVQTGDAADALSKFP